MAAVESPMYPEKPTVSQSQVCPDHGPSKTPRIDSLIHTSDVRQRMLAMSRALAEAAEGDSCTKCSTVTLVQLLIQNSRDLKAIKDKGNWSKEDRKALKQEMKTLERDLQLKKSMKASWKGKQ